MPTRTVLAALGAVVLIFTSSLALAADAGNARVMTRNLYIGADVFAALDVETPDQIPFAAGAVLAEIIDSDFPARARVLAREIQRTQPQVIGLQEVWDVNTLGTGPDLRIDFLSLLQSELASLGQKYEAAVVNTNVDVTLPVFLPDFGLFAGRITDRDVILVRHNVGWSNPAAALYDTRIPTGFGFDIVRGWTSVDVTFGGNAYRFLNTHLEVQGFGNRAVQTFQAAELLGVMEFLKAAYGPLPEVVVGDFNSDPDDPPCGDPACGLFGVPTNPYDMLSEPAAPFFCRLDPGTDCFDGLTDAWTLRKNDRSSDGDTCCFDTLDAEEAGEVTRRVDLIWLRGAEARGATFRLTGDDPKRTTPEGLYGSDHLGVFGRMTLVPAY
ncbi:MAG: endonuclease/exonuclease/phosphatase family protein [Gammaproteobacteria bacterium]